MMQDEIRAYKTRQEIKNATRADPERQQGGAIERANW